MNKEEYFRHQERTHEKCLEISRAKCADYTNEDPFSNFRSVQGLGLCSIEVGILVRMTDKFSRISNLLGNKKEAQVKNESVQDTLYDLINYSAILLAYLDSKGNDNCSNDVFS